jgi:hypothetical protein
MRLRGQEMTEGFHERRKVRGGQRLEPRGHVLFESCPQFPLQLMPVDR